jgi:hypothetical protein
MSFKHY